MDFGRVYSVLADFLRQEGFPIAVVGGLGLHAYGSTRTTQDLDVVTDTRAQPKTIAFLESMGYETLHASEGYSNHLHADSAFGRIDVVYVGGETSRLLFAGCRERFQLGGKPVPVPRAEHLIAMKVQAIKNDSSRRLRDLADIAYLLERPDIDRAEVAGYFVRAGLSKDLDELRKDL